MSAFGYDLHSVNVIKKNIDRTLLFCGVRCKSAIENGGKSIHIFNNLDSNHNEHCFIWIRLLPCGNGKYYVDISNIILPLSKRNCGTFQIVYNRLSNCKYVERVRIISVCTNEMRRWCAKNKLRQYEDGCYT